MRCKPIELAGKEYPLRFSLRAVKACGEKYGSLEKMFEAIQGRGGGTLEVVDDCLWLLGVMLDAGYRYNRASGLEALEPPDAELLLDVLELAEGAEQAAKALDKGGKATLTFGDLLKANLLSDAIAAGARKLADALEAVGRAALDLGRQSLEGFSQFEQLSGGVKTLLGTEAGSLEEYANSVGKSVEEARAEYEQLLSSQQLVFANADRAFQSAGLSANEYMETVTGFAASLLQGLGGDTVEAARLADLAITDMADNANKMGTDMQSIQNAYQGFAKQNYTIKLMSAA